MKRSTREWVTKAEEDFLAATALDRRRKKPLWNVIAFHAQQSVEKYLKARLEEAGLVIPKTHDLVFVLGLVVPIEPLWAAWQNSFALLASYAVQSRYPGNAVRKDEAREALRICRSFRKEARSSLGSR
jgi:HEPN domain-containing protein